MVNRCAMSFPKASIIIGAALVVAGCVGAAIARTMVDDWWYGLIPAFIGAPVVILGVLGLRLPKFQRVTMALAYLIAALGTVGSFMPHGMNFSNPGSVAYVSSIFRLITVVACGCLFLVGPLCLKRAKS